MTPNAPKAHSSKIYLLGVDANENYKLELPVQLLRQAGQLRPGLELRQPPLRNPRLAELRSQQRARDAGVGVGVAAAREDREDVVFAVCGARQGADGQLHGVADEATV